MILETRASLRAAAATAVLTSACCGQVPIRTVAYSGQQAPGTGAGALFAGLSAPALNEAGEVALLSTLSGSVTPSNNQGIWFGQPGFLGLVVRTGQSAPG